MILIIGGAYQGKHEYLRQTYGDLPSERLLDNLHLWVLTELRAGRDPVKYISGHIDDYDDKIVVCQDISCGIVPIDAEQRCWREAVGRCCSILAAHADSVVRVFCGIATGIK